MQEKVGSAEGFALIRVLQLKFGEGTTIMSWDKSGVYLSSPFQVPLTGRCRPGKLQAVGRIWGTRRRRRNVSLLMQSEYIPGEIACLLL